MYRRRAMSKGRIMHDEAGDRGFAPNEQTRRPGSAGPIVVVGPCASGKTTLVTGLRSLGYRAVVCGQEHSEIPFLWRRSEPDVLIALDVDLATVRRRRGENWPESIFNRQRTRLAVATAAADLVLDVSHLSESAVLARVVRALELAGLPIDRTRPRSAPDTADRS
jgi:hypothetical protein